MPIDKNPGESKDDFIGRCMSIEIKDGKPQDQAYAICISKWENMATASVTDNTWSTEAPINVNLESYSDYPDSVKSNARNVLDWVEQNGWGSCGTAVGKQRANQYCPIYNLLLIFLFLLYSPHHVESVLKSTLYIAHFVLHRRLHLVQQP